MRASLDHRLYVLRYVRRERRWPTLDELHYLVVGRWRGF